MTVKFSSNIILIPVSKIHVLNPRERGRNKFQQIAANIGAIGLKKPVTVAIASTKNGETLYNLVCGQGRLEAYIFLGEEEIPCIIAEGTKEELQLMSLAENLARRQHSCIDLVRQLGTMKSNGYSYPEIAKKIGMETNYVRGLLKLLEKGEERLLQAVEKGILPVSVAVTIASSDDRAVQQALQEAYENNDLRGDALVKVKRIIENRRNKGKVSRSAPRTAVSKEVSSKDLVETYQGESLRQQSLIRKSKAFESRLLMAISAFKEVYSNDQFQGLLKQEQLSSLPQFLAERVTSSGRKS